MFWVYIIKSQKDKKFYTGITKNSEAREKEKWLKSGKGREWRDN
ncbi:MAG: GIY-YIG nuclease family protein, partial [Candidatus Paceibacterota bacterium]